MFKNSLALLSCFCLLSSCVYERLSVYTDYVGLDSLASYHIGTPDPELANPHLGQRLLISWRLSREYRERDDLQIRLNRSFYRPHPNDRELSHHVCLRNPCLHSSR